MIEGLTTWAKERPAVAALMGGGLVVALIVLVMVMTGGGPDVAPVVGSTGAEAGGTPAATGAAQPDAAVPGTTVADGAQESAAQAAPESETVPLASKEAQETTRQNEVGLNSGLAPVNATGSGTPVIGTTPVSTDKTTPPGVAAAGRELERAADDVRACIEAGTKGDVFECLSVMPDTIEVEKIHERAPQGAVIYLSSIDGQVVKLSFRGDTECRMVGEGTSCNAWDAA